MQHLFCGRFTKAFVISVLLVFGFNSAHGQALVKARPLQIYSTGGGNLTLTAPGAGIGNYTLTFPGSAPAINQGLVSDGSGNLSWVGPFLPLSGGTLSGGLTGTTFSGTSFSGDGSALTGLAGGNITAGTITNTQISATAGIVASKLNDGSAAAGQVLTAVGGGAPTWQTPNSIPPTYYYYAYTIFVPATVPIGGTVPTTTVAQNSGFLPDVFGGFTVIAAGIYKVEYAVAHNEAGAFALTVDGVVAAGSQFGAATGTTITNGSAILTLNAGTLVRLINSPNSTVAMTLSPVVFGTVVASLTAVRLQ
jgi:hypothetical protein